MGTVKVGLFCLWHENVGGECTLIFSATADKWSYAMIIEFIYTV